MDELERDKKQSQALVYAAFVAGLCSIVYELLIATTVSYFVGDSVTYFSLTIGMYMAAMGAGSFCSKFIGEKLVDYFLLLEILLAAIGGLSVPLLYLAYTYGELFMPTYVVTTLLVGFLIGMEIPFLTRLMESFQSLKVNIAHILSLDYVGALIATLAFPFFLLPVFGNYLSSLILGVVNLSIVMIVFICFKSRKLALEHLIKRGLFIVFVILLLGIVLSQTLLERWDQSLFNDRIVHAEQTHYQKVIITKNEDDVRLYLNGNIQFSSVDEYRYHEALIHFPIAYKSTSVRRVLLLGAGDGLAVKQLLKYPKIDEIVLVDLDPKIVEIAKTNPHLHKLNNGSLYDERVTTIASDALVYLENNQVKFDLIVADLPDPNNLSLTRLYSKYFYHLARQNLSDDGVFVTQATSPYYATKAFWSIANTIKSAQFKYVIPYHAQVPAFGDWGFVMAVKTHGALLENSKLTVETQFITEETIPTMTVFPKDIVLLSAKINRLDRPVLLDYYLEGWRSHGY